MDRKVYPSGFSDEEWAFAAPCLVLFLLDAGQHPCDLRGVINALRIFDAERRPVMHAPGQSAVLVARVLADAALAEGRPLRGDGVRSSHAAPSRWPCL